MEILKHLDLLLDFHEQYDKYYVPNAPDENYKDLHPSFSEAEQKLEEKRKLYQSHYGKLISEIIDINKPEEREYINQLYEILEEDKLIKEDKSHRHITLKGRMYEGYIRRKEINRTNNFLNQVQIWAVILGGGIAGIWYCLEILHKYLIPFLYYLIY